jgi:MFS family permease
MAAMQKKPVPGVNQSEPRGTIGVWAVFITQFVSFLFINARNIAQPQMISELDGITLFSWLIALPALAGAASTLLFGKLSDLFGRRTVLLISIAIFGVGLALTSQVTTMPLLIASTTFMSIGHWPIVPLCFSAIGDLFSEADRAKWTGLLNLPTGIAAIVGPVLGGAIAESVVGWRGLYWGTIPLLLIAGGFVAVALPKNEKIEKPQIDLWGTLVMVIATTSLIIGFSWLGTPTKRGIGAVLLLISIAGWVLFISIERSAKEPILDTRALFNRSFLTIAATGFLFFFGSLGIGAYSPIFVQEVMGISPTISGSMLTPYSMLIAFMGIPVGFLLARTGKYKKLYIISYLIIFAGMIGTWRLTSNSPIWVYVLVTSVAGFGMGAIPTINTLVAQLAVPKRLLGVAVGALYFFQMVGISIAPTILGVVQNSAPDLEIGLNRVFLVCAIAMAVSLGLIFSLPEISMNNEHGQ